MQTQLTFQCPHCDQRLQSLQEHAGLSFDCPQCTNSSSCRRRTLWCR